MDSSPPASDPAAKPRPFRVLSFPSAGLDTVLQMGVIHALLVTRRRPPDMVAGLSVGAITATALGEVFHASAGEAADRRDDEEVRVARFNELLEAFRNAPTTLVRGAFPDPLETNASFALKPVELPRHFREERDHRQESATSRLGLIRLFHHFINLRVRVKVVAQLTRLHMGWTAAGLEPRGPLWVRRGCLLLQLWWLLAKNVVALSMPVSLVARVALLELLGLNGKTKPPGVDAEHIMFRRQAWLLQLREQLSWFALGFLPLVLSLALLPGLLLEALLGFSGLHLPGVPDLSGWKPLLFSGGIASVVALWSALLWRKGLFKALLRHFRIYHDLGDSHRLKELFVQNFDPTYYGEFQFDESVRRALNQEQPSTGGTAKKKPLHTYAEKSHRRTGVIVKPLAANLGTGKLEAFPTETSVVDALMCASAVVPFFRAQSLRVQSNSKTYIDGSSISNDPILLAFEEASRHLAAQSEQHWDSLQITSVALVPLKQEGSSCRSEPYTGLVDVSLRALELQGFQDMLSDKSLIDRISRSVGANPTVVQHPSSGPMTYMPTKVRLVVPDRAPHLTLNMLHACSGAERRGLINAAVADGCRAMIERLVLEALPDTRTQEERRRLQESKTETPDEWPHIDPAVTATLREAVEKLRRTNQTVTTQDGAEFAPCRSLMEAWGGLQPLPGGEPCKIRNPGAGPGSSEVCRNCIAHRAQTGPDGTPSAELRQHVRLPRREPAPTQARAQPLEIIEEPAIIFLFSGGVFRGVFQVGFSNAASELGIQPDVLAGASVGTIIGALTGRVFKLPGGNVLLERQRQMRRMAATFLSIDRFVLTDRFADFVRHFSIHAASADFSPCDLDHVFRRYDKDGALAFGRRARRVFAGFEQLFYVSPFELLDLVRSMRAGRWQETAQKLKKLTQEMVDRYGVGLELLGAEPLQQLIEGFVFDGNSEPATRLSLFGFPLMGTATNLTQGKLDILRSTHPWDPRFTQGALASSAFPAVFRPRWSWEVYRHPEQTAQYADGGIMDNLPLGAVVEYLSGEETSKRYARRPTVPHLILTATLEPEKADWSGRDDLGGLCWTEIRERARQLHYNGKIDKFQLVQRLIRRLLRQRSDLGDPDAHAADQPLNLDVLAVKPRWLPGTFAFHPMLGFSRSRQAESIAHGCASTLCTVAAHFDPANDSHGVDIVALRKWAMDRGIALHQLPAPIDPNQNGPLAYGPAELTETEQQAGGCWFRQPDATTGKRPVCPFHRLSPAAADDELAPELHKIYLACGKRRTHESRSS